MFRFGEEVYGSNGWVVDEGLWFYEWEMVVAGYPKMKRVLYRGGKKEKEKKGERGKGRNSDAP